MEFTRSIEYAPETMQRMVKISHILRQAIAALEEEPNIYRQIPGLICLAHILLFDSERLRAAEDDPSVVSDDIDARIVRARIYLDRVGGALDQGGKAMGCLINALLVASRPQDATQEQIEIWGCDPHIRGGQNVDIKLLLPVWAIVKIMERISQLSFDMGDGTRKTGSELMRATFQQLGSPDANGICALLAATEEGTLTHLTCVQTFSALRKESATFSSTPEPIRNAARRRVHGVTGSTPAISDTQKLPRFQST